MSQIGSTHAVGIRDYRWPSRPVVYRTSVQIGVNLKADSTSDEYLIHRLRGLPLHRRRDVAVSVEGELRRRVA